MEVENRTVTSWTRPQETGASWTDFEDIRQVLSGYCYLVDQAINAGVTPDLFELYHPEVTFTNSFEAGLEHVGYEAVAAWYDSYLGSRAGYYRWVRHKISESFIALDGDTALTSAYFDADSVDRDGLVRAMAGRYDDKFVKVEGRWLIKDRHVSIYYSYTAGEAAEYKGRKRRQ